MRAAILIPIFFLCVQMPLLATEIVISGVYLGKDIFVQNPYSPSAKSFCTQAVFVNGSQIITNPNTSAFKINLANLKINEPVDIRIVHNEGCAPRLINPEVIKPADEFLFVDAKVSRTSLSWMAKGELPGGNYIIEKMVGDSEWKDLTLTPAKGNVTSSNYQIPVAHSGGQNYYRVRFEGPDGNQIHSQTINFDFKEEPVTFYPIDPTTRITLSRPIEYLVTDQNGNKYLEGKSDFINVKDLPSGDYILHLQNRKESFTIKRELKPIKRKKDDQS